MSEFGHGSVVRLKLKDFMQFGSVEFRPGPTLNVVLGPNGAGKSSLVNAIALALGAKTSVLGRADSISDFIRTGCSEASTEIELFNGEQGQSNFVIGRIFNKQSKSKWTLNDKSSTQKEVIQLVKGLNIQTDNLCQFLPQDKVHDFSKMNPKELLVKTVDAVGDIGLKADHEQLKQMQADLGDNEERFRVKQATLETNLQRCQQLEEAVQSYEAKEALQTRMYLLKKKLEWCLVEEAKLDFRKQQKVRDEAKKRVQVEEAKLEPVRDTIRKLEQKRQDLDLEVKRCQVAAKENQTKSQQRASKMEQLAEKLTNLDNQYMDEVNREQERVDYLQKLTEEHDNLVRDVKEAEEKEGDNREALEQTARKMHKDMNALHTLQNQLQEKMRDNNYERKAVENQINQFKMTQEKLGNVSQQKVELMRRLLPDGKDAYAAMQWLEDNRDQFEGRVYTPLILHIDVLDAAVNAKYLENTIPPKELVAFAAENAEDANKMMRQFREKMKLRVNVVQLDIEADPDKMRHKSGPRDFGPELEFRAYLKDMFQAPSAIKAYLCRLYYLHLIPVFGKSADNFTGKLVQDFKTFYCGDVRHKTMVSKYSGNASTTSVRIMPRNVLKTSVDKEKVKEVEAGLESSLKSHRELMEAVQALNAELKAVDKELESKKQELKAIKQKLHWKNILRGKLSAKENQLIEFKRTMEVVDMEVKRAQLNTQRIDIATKTVRLSEELCQSVVEGSKAKLAAEVARTKVMPMQTQVDNMIKDLEEREGDLDGFRIQLGEEEETLRAFKETVEKQLRAAQNVTDSTGRFRGKVPPQALLDAFETHDLQEIGSDEARIRIQECEGELECLEDVDPSAVKEYKQLKVAIDELQEELERWSANVGKRKEEIAQIRDRWLVKLEAMVDQISTHFSNYFELMGFAGEVQLNKGSHDSDFGNYGIDVLVKFRERLPLQRLDPFKQSGGERSVSTALYMMALQSLTKVPFRCVDEINQGMDAKNERKVFDLLIETSVRANSAQYFLLTPKLLPDLHYEEGVTVLIVHNGKEMCRSNEWSIAQFVRAAQAVKSYSIS